MAKSCGKSLQCWLLFLSLKRILLGFFKVFFSRMVRPKYAFCKTYLPFQNILNMPIRKSAIKLKQA